MSDKVRTNRRKRPITCAERIEMQHLRDGGMSIRSIGLAFECHETTVRYHTKSVPAVDVARRNAEILKRYAGLSMDERDALARRYGLASAKSLEVTICVYRRSLRAADSTCTGAQA